MSATVSTGVSYLGRDDNVRLANDEVELVMPSAYGPRVMRYAARGGRNVLGEIAPETVAKDTPFGDRWHIHGGHRLWYAPETDPGSYFPDNRPVQVEIEGARVRLTQAVESHSGLEKSIALRLADSGSGVTLEHTLRNRGDSAVELAPWALTVMAQGGTALFPQPVFAPHPQALAPARPLVVWSFTRMTDPRWTWGDHLLCLRQDPTLETPQKVGMYDARGFMAYALGGSVFLKRHEPLPGTHADFGCNVETFSNELFLELETLGPLVRLAPGASVVHRERWNLFEGVRFGDDELENSRHLEELVARADA
jgi:hypothetical protein